MDGAALRDHPPLQGWLLEHQSAGSGALADADNLLREAGLDSFKDVDGVVIGRVPRTEGDEGMAAFGGRCDAVPADREARDRTASAAQGCLRRWQ